MTDSTEEIYDKAAADWARTDRLMLSDFTARPYAVEALAPLAEMRVLDLGCGEGYVARMIRDQGANEVVGVELAANMVDLARDSSAGDPAMTWHQADAAEIGFLDDASFDRVVCVFLFNYLTCDHMQRVLKQAHRVLRPGGQLVFTVPHPLLPWLRDETPPFYFEGGDQRYLRDVDRTFEGRIWRRDGVSVPVRAVHKRLGDYFSALAAAGFTTMPSVTDLCARPEHHREDPAFFGPLGETPLHLLFALSR